MVIVVVPAGQDELVAQRMMYELLDEPGGARRLVAMYEEDSASEQIWNVIGAGDRVVIVLGAEAFTEGGWVFFGKGGVDRVKRLEDAIRKRGGECAVVVVVGSFKRQEDRVLVEGESFRHSLGHVAVCAEGIVNVIVSDDEVKWLDRGAWIR